MVANQPPRAFYAGAILLASALGAACAFLVAQLVGDAGGAPRAAGLVVAGASIVGLLPALVRAADRFGVAVLLASVTRLLIVLAGCVALTEVGAFARRPIWLGAVSGALLILIAESVLAVAILAAIERHKAGGSARLATQESHGSC